MRPTAYHCSCVGDASMQQFLVHTATVASESNEALSPRAGPRRSRSIGIGPPTEALMMKNHAMRIVEPAFGLTDWSKIEGHRSVGIRQPPFVTVAR